MRYQPFAAAAVALLLAGGGAATAASAETWDFGGDPDNNMATATNWDTNAVPAQGSPWTFGSAGSSAVQNNGVNYSSSLITFNRSFGLSGQPILANDITIVGSPITVNLSLPISLNVGTSFSWTIPAGSTMTQDDPTTIGAAPNYLYFGDAGTMSFLPGGAVNGNQVILDDAGVVNLLGGGDLDKFSLSTGNVHSGSVMSNLDITALSGTVSGGASTNVLGNQQLVQSVTLNNASIISPGSSVLGGDLGYFHSSGTVVGNPLATYRFGYNGLDSDHIVTQGVFDANGTRLEFDHGTLPAVGTEYEIVDAAGGPVAGSYFTAPDGVNQLTDDEVFFADPGYFRIEYRTTGIVLVYVGLTPPPAPPLPATGAVATPVIVATGLAVVAVGGLLLLLRRRVA